MKIIGLPAFVGSYDNYIWVLIERQSAWVIDPGQAQPVIDYLKSNDLTLQGILLTHYHHDHVEGVAELLNVFNSAPVYGSAKTPNQHIRVCLNEGDTVSLFENYTISVLETPGHTYDHISFYNDQDLFCGDTLFAAGCGRQFDGGYAAFAQSILKLRDLPQHLNFYSAHEYTESNLTFAAFVDPHNADLQHRIAQTDITYPQIKLTPQSTLQLETQTNPFLRFDQAPLKQLLLAKGATDSTESLFKTLRDWKDQIDTQGYPNK